VCDGARAAMLGYVVKDLDAIADQLIERYPADAD
jgi:hypothetical protein